MSSTIDPAKLKVIELRNELAARGLDQKGVKAVLVKRLADALEKESESEEPDTSIAETDPLAITKPEETPRKSTRKSADEKEEAKPTRSATAVTPAPEKAKPPPKTPAKTEPPPSQVKSTPKPQPVQPKPVEVAKPAAAPSTIKSTINNTEDKKPDKPATVVKTETKPLPPTPKTEVKTPEKPKPEVKAPEKKPEVKTPEKPKVEIKTPEKPKTEIKIEKPTPAKQVEKAPEQRKPEVKPAEKPKPEVKSSVKPKIEVKSPEKPKAATVSTAKTLGEANGDQVPMETQDVSQKSDKQAKGEVAKSDTAQRGEKRKRSSDSPERPAKRARTPPQEDEPPIDAEAVLLSWYDSDLHLQVDKSTFLSAKPITDGAFGYIWAGARATHGISSGKACYEVKITEKLKWEDFAKPMERLKQDHKRTPRHDDRKHSKKSESKDGKKEDKEKSEGIEKKENSDKKEDASEKKGESMEVIESEETDEKTQQDAPGTDKVVGDTKSDEPMETESTDKKTEDKDKKSEDKDKKSEDKDKKSEDKDKKPEDKEVKEGENEKKEAKPEEPPLPSHFFRIGWSVFPSSLQLGEDKHSFAYESSGKFVKNKEFVDYGVTFDVDAVIGAYVDVSAKAVILRFSVNGVLQPATEIPKSDLPENFVLYPHILTRNYGFEVNFGQKEEPWFAVPSELTGYQFLSKVEKKVAGPTRPAARSDCEVLLMFGLPASGKSHWVKEHIEENKEKNYTILGNQNILQRMTINGEPLKSKFKARWSILIDRIQKCLNRLVIAAASRRRNYIIDQTNVYASAQRRKMRPFEGFKRKAVIVVVADEEQARRQGLQEAVDGKEVPDSTILGMKGAMTLPEIGEWLEEVSYVGLEETEAKEMVKKYNEVGKAAGFGQEYKKPGENRWNYRRNDRGRNYQRGGSGGYRQNYSSSGGRRGWQQPSRRDGGGGGGWKQDPRSREWRGGGYDQRSRDYYNQGGYDRSRNQSSGNRSSSGGWGSSGGGGGWGGRSQGGGWNQQAFGSGSGTRNYSQNWGGNSGNQAWGKYGQGQGGQSQGYGNWNNYYGQQHQGNWSQGQQQQQAPMQQQTSYPTNMGATAVQGQQYTQQAYNTQEAWAQYARQYAQHQQMAQAAAAAQKR